MTGLYVISVILLMAFLMNIVDSLGMTYGYLVFNLYIAGLLNVALWIYLFRRIRKDTSTPFFMNWMKNMDCDVLILLTAVFLLEPFSSFPWPIIIFMCRFMTGMASIWAAI